MHIYRLYVCTYAKYVWHTCAPHACIPCTHDAPHYPQADAVFNVAANTPPAKLREFSVQGMTNVLYAFTEAGLAAHVQRD